MNIKEKSPLMWGLFSSLLKSYATDSVTLSDLLFSPPKMDPKISSMPGIFLEMIFITVFIQLDTISEARSSRTKMLAERRCW